jgi:ribA/ribD-fused uncharacterized protein
MGMRCYDINNCIAFRKTKEAFGGLSNMSSGYSINIHDVIIPSSEHLYQACRFPDYPELQWEIINEPSPMKAKWIAKANINLTRPDWDLVRFKIMDWVLKLKLSQNWDNFSTLLLATSNLNIVEETKDDKVWGAKRVGPNYIGVNALGRLLMNIRETIVFSGNHNVCVHPVNISNFKFLGNEIGLICYDDEMNDLEADLQINVLTE